MSEQVESAEKFRKAKEFALRYVSYRPRSSWEVRRKMAEKGYDEEIVTLVTLFLREYNFLDDEEFTKMWVRSRLGEKPSGRRRIFAELAQKGIDKELIDRHLAGITPDKEEEMVTALVEKKCCKTGFNYNRLRGFLLRRGFSTATIGKVLEKYAKNNTDWCSE